MHKAAKSGDVAAVRRLVDSGADLEEPTAQPQPPLPPPGLRYPVIEQRPSLEGMRVNSEKYNKARDHFVEMMDPVLSVH